MATISQEFSKIVKYEEDLQNQYRIIFLNLINIYLDSLVQQKMIEPEQKQEMSDEFCARLRETESEWRSKIKASIRVRTVPLLYSTAIIGQTFLSPRLCYLQFATMFRSGNYYVL